MPINYKSELISSLVLSITLSWLNCVFTFGTEIVSNRVSLIMEPEGTFSSKSNDLLRCLQIDFEVLIKGDTMKTKISQLIVLLLIGFLPAMAQSTDRKAVKEQKRIEHEKEIAALVNSKSFEFKARRALPTGFRPMDLTTNPNFIRFSPELIIS